MTPLDFDLDGLRAELAERPFRQLSGDGGQRPHWSVIAADERQYADLPSEVSDEHASRGDWQDAYPLDVVEDRTLSDEMPPGYDSRVWRQSL